MVHEYAYLYEYIWKRVYYSGVVWLRQWNTITAKRNFMRSGTRSQCKSNRSGEMRSYLWLLHASLAAALSTDCKRFIRRVCDAVECCASVVRGAKTWHHSIVTSVAFVPCRDYTTWTPNITLTLTLTLKLTSYFQIFFYCWQFSHSHIIHVQYEYISYKKQYRMAQK